MFKRLFDLYLSLSLLLIISPLFLIMPILIKLDSPGPVFFGRRLVGYQGKLYMLYKFRIMFVDRASQTDIPYHERLTRIGRFMKKTGIDELPQLWSILKGEMSFIGPAPVSPELVDLQNPTWQRYLLARPGMVGPSFLQRGYMHVARKQQEEIELDADYGEKQSLRYDFLLIRQAIKSRQK